MTTTLTPVLDADVIYLIGQTFACGTTRCAGSTAVYSGHGLHDETVTPVTPEDVAEWATYDLGPLTCECGRLQASPLADSRGRAITKHAE